ncbi:hypothetical protein [Paenibacillus senegalimassiliensis]|uniref:hypothetical protein n=1 Tax=Paenibacillus senegalimassiliensis TaxID=1737426 RepID=UPI00073E5D4F|nr:hypothetical protein [Paenibacillus senegalimassiliensis]
MPEGYIAYIRHLKPVPGQLPDVTYDYVSNESHIGWHMALTQDRSEAYVFDADELLLVDQMGFKIKKI